MLFAGPKRPLGARLGAIVLIAGVLAVVAPAFTVVEAAEPITVTNNSQQTVQVPVVPGLKPSAISGSLSAPESRHGGNVAGGTVIVTAGGQEVYRGEAKATKFEAQLENPKLTNGNLTVAIRYGVPGLRLNYCSSNFQQLNLDVNSVTFTGKQTVPKTVSDFLQPGVSAINVVIPQESNGDQVSAGLAAIGAAAFSLGPDADTRISLGSVDRRIVEKPGARVIKIENALGPATTTLGTEKGVPTLTIAGRSSTLTEAATELGGTQTTNSQSSGAVSTGATKPPDKPNQTFVEMGLTDATLKGWGSQTLDIAANQSQFGGSIRDVRVRLVGVRSQIPAGAKANLNVIWNKELVETLDLNSMSRIAADIEVPNPLLKEINQLRVELETLPADGSCSGDNPATPVTVTLDPQQSQVRTSRGQTIAPGFARFPQALNGELPVAFAQGKPSQATVQSAALLVASLQRVNVPQLMVEVVPFTEASTSLASTLVVDADESVSTRLGAPMLLNSVREIRTPEHNITSRGGVPFSAFEAFSSGTRNMLMLGGWAPPRSPASEVQGTSLSLAEYVYALPGGWSSLQGDIALVEPGSEPQTLNSNAMVPQEPVIRADGWVLVWMVGVIVVFVGAGVWRYLHVTRRQKAGES